MSTHKEQEGVLDIDSIEDTNILISQDFPSKNPTATGVSSSVVIKNPEDPEVNKIKRKRCLTSAVWKDYERIENPDGSMTAKCKYCSYKTNGDSSKGTTHLATHTKNCRHHPREDIRQAILASSSNSANTIRTYRFDAEFERTLFAQMVMKHDYPFLLVEREFFRKWVSYICPMYKFRTRNTIKSDCLEVYKIEKAKLQSIFDGISSRVSLTTDLWTLDHQNLGYCCVTCHYIDDSWALNKKIIAFNYVECPHIGGVLASWLKQNILEWNISFHLSKWKTSLDKGIQEMAKLMQIKFDKYWELCGFTLTIGMILDPRYKMQFVEYTYGKLYGSASEVQISQVVSSLRDLYESYVDTTDSEEVVVDNRSTELFVEGMSNDLVTADWQNFVTDKNQNVELAQISELDTYLNESLHPERKDDTFLFDILNWWNHTRVKFPVLRKMARDILAIPVSTVASESAFSWGRRIIEDTRSSVKSDTVEAILCCKD